ncbi:MAG: sigma-70 family RNA polymerase sigma factor [Haliscomenobacteraceae bacterium CHB4]|nr:ECF RNA polymerase sigma factor SigE [Saprospiraceae bacterium]MCE7925693.1 sigma-70 family RNA polymerase sigma factor [Haliscomenobacteraceae bacterium CHB4]
MAFFGKKNYTEQELVEGCARNERRAQEALYRRFFPEMLRMCRRYTRDEDTAIEIANNGFLRVFKKIHTFAFKGSLEGWVRRLVYHSMADYFRDNARYLHFLVLEERDEAVPERGHEVFYEEDILRAVRTLPPVSQEVFRLFAIEGYSHAEIAENLSISEGTSKWHLSTARQKLREILSAQMAPPNQRFNTAT